MLIGFALGTLAHPLAAPADPRTDCSFGTRDPGSVARGCTALIESRKVPEAWMYFNRGLAYKMLGQFKKALRDYTQAIDRDPTFGAAYTNRANVKLLRNDLAGALADFRTALELDPNDEVARENLAAIEAALRKVGAEKPDKNLLTLPAR